MANPFPSPNPNSTLDTQQQPQNPANSYRKGSWTVQETLTLIDAKRLQGEQRHAAASSPFPYLYSAQQSWKCIENYCCSHGCLRSQYQCTSKWDYLLREYEKVSEYESRNAAAEPGTGANRKSYWEMERRERKEFNLPPNMDFNVHKSLTAILNLCNARRNPISPTPVTVIPPEQPPKDPSPSPAVTQAAPQTEDSAEVDQSVEEEREMKRNKAGDLGMTMVYTAPLLSQTSMTSEEKKQMHKELMEQEERRLRLEERRLSLEEGKSEMKKQAVSGLLSAISGLSSAVHTLVSEERSPVDGGCM